MPGPPPPPKLDVDLRAELRPLETPDVLALCLLGKSSAPRLRLYLSVLRERGNARDQLAACMVCFDLGKLGDTTAQKELLALAPTILGLAQDQALVDSLLGGDAYLEASWAECRQALESQDPREEGHALDDDASPLELALLSDEDLDVDLDLDLDVEVTEPTGPAPERVALAIREYAQVMAEHLGQHVEQGQFAADDAFSTSSARDLDRLDRFFVASAARAGLVPVARGMASLGPLYLATHLRRKGLFGRRNPRRNQALRDGLLALPLDVEAVSCAAALFELAGPGVQEGFEKVLELLMDYVSFCRLRRLDPRAPATVTSYVETEREAPQVLLTNPLNRRRG